MSETIDLSDIASFGNGSGIGVAAALAHEIAEQTVKQSGNLPDTELAYLFAHQYANSIENSVSGFSHGSTGKSLLKEFPMTGITMTRYSRGSKDVTVEIVWYNGNIVKVFH